MKLIKGLIMKKPKLRLRRRKRTKPYPPGSRRTRVRIKFVGSKKDPKEVSASGAPIGVLAINRAVGIIVNDSPTYNSCFLVNFNGNVYDIHDQHFEYLPCICSMVSLQQKGCKCGGI